MQDLIYGEEVDRRLNWSLGRAERFARKQKLPHYVLPDGSIRFVWDEVERMVRRVAVADESEASDAS